MSREGDVTKMVTSFFIRKNCDGWVMRVVVGFRLIKEEQRSLVVGYLMWILYDWLVELNI